MSSPENPSPPAGRPPFRSLAAKIFCVDDDAPEDVDLARALRKAAEAVSRINMLMMSNDQTERISTVHTSWTEECGWTSVLVLE